MTKKYALLAWLVSFGLAPGGAMAQDADYQFRLMLHHLPPAPSGTAGTRDTPAGSGFAGWAIVPDADAEPVKGLFLGGFGWRKAWTEESSLHVRWLEMLGGTLISGKDGAEPMLGVRSFIKNERGDTYGEVLYNFRTRRTLIQFHANTPLALAPWFRVGLEAEALLGGNDRAKDRKPVVGCGPRIALPIPLARGRGTWAMGLQFRTRGQPLVVRQYLTIIW